jgi:hypothetical protein
MGTEITEFLQVCFSGANLPASILLTLSLLYSLLAILAGLDLDFLDFDLDMDSEPDFASAVGAGFVVLRFLNLGRVPFMLWVGIFSVCWWLTSVLFDRLLDDPTHREILMHAFQYSVRNIAVALIATKIMTHPLRDKFDVKEPNRAQDLLGRECVVTTSEVTDSFGQAEVSAEASPLRLNVRTTGEPLCKGDVAVIVDFDRENNLYFVQKPEKED